MFEFGYAAVPAIVIIAWFVAEGYKKATDEKYHKYIPELVGLIGIVIALLVYFFIPEYLETTNILDTVVIGIISGLSTTGLHQAVKQKKE